MPNRLLPLNPQRNKGNLNRFLIVGFSLFLTACTESDLFHASLPTSPTAWVRNDSLQWKVNVTDTLKPYGVWIEIRNDNRFEYRNLGLEVIEIAPDSTVVRRDTMNYFLMDENGKWTGSGWGSLYTGSFLFDSEMIFPASGEYTFIIRPALTDKRITGIHSIGLRIGIKK